MKYILDASVAIKWVLAEQDSAVAIRIRDDARNRQAELIAPDFFLAECGHALFRLARRKLIGVSEANQCLLAIMFDCPNLMPFVPLVPRASYICQQTGIGFYDSLYIALAEQENCQLITADTKLVINVTKKFPLVIDLANFP